MRANIVLNRYRDHHHDVREGLAEQRIMCPRPLSCHLWRQGNERLLQLLHPRRQADALDGGVAALAKSTVEAQRGLRDVSGRYQVSA